MQWPSELNTRLYRECRAYVSCVGAREGDAWYSVLSPPCHVRHLDGTLPSLLVLLAAL